MRLLTIANRYYLSTLSVVFVVGSLAAYFILKSIINHEFNEKLYAEQDQLIYELNNYANLEKNYYLNIGDVIDLEEVTVDPKMKPILRDTVMYDPYEKKELPFRQLIFSDQIKSKFYLITISKSLLPNQDLIEGVSEIMIGLALLIVLSLGLLNRIIFTKLWHPFHNIIHQLQKFKITQPEPIKLSPSDVDEFNKLGEVLDQMISKNIHDYIMLKEYTENTSHEIQTPLAIIKNKAEILLQEPLGERQLTDISKIYEAAGRLSRLKEGLSTLNKIENNQFVVEEKIDLQEFISGKISSLEELLELKSLKVHCDFESSPILYMNNDLAYMLITNLLNNAIKHNFTNGSIHIYLDMNMLMIENTGKPPLVPTSELFDRFKRSGSSSESTGLGLSIVQKITNQYNIEITYVYEEPLHRIILNFENMGLK